MAELSKTELLRTLEQLEKSLAKEFIKETNPGNWVGRGSTSFDMTEKQKNARLLDKNNAKSTYALIKSVRDYRKELTAPLKKGEKFVDVVDENQAIAKLNEQAEANYKHLMSLN